MFVIPKQNMDAAKLAEKNNLLQPQLVCFVDKFIIRECSYFLNHPPESLLVCASGTLCVIIIHLLSAFLF